VPAENVHVVGDRVLGLECFPTPGHASHHVSYVDPDSTLYAGDAAGVRIATLAYVLPPLPPPDIDIEAWHRTIDEIERRAPERLALIHFGIADDVEWHLASLRRRLDAWAELVRDGITQDEFVAAATEEMHRALNDAEGVAAYDQAIPLWQSYLGLKRYWEKKREAA
jgi:glyoxylase-like metal-dependent hydrolase (beta-lactamase superfamily II)